MRVQVIMQATALTKKYQATIPEEIRKHLQLKAGDKIAFEIVGKEVKVRKATPMDLLFCKALEPTLSEWMTKEDDEAYGDL